MSPCSVCGIPMHCVGPKPFAAAQHAVNTCRKTAVQTADKACLQIGSLCWYPSMGTFVTRVVPSKLSYLYYLGYFYYLWVIVGLWVIICCVYKFGNIDNKVKAKRQKVPSIFIDSLSIFHC